MRGVLAVGRLAYSAAESSKMERWAVAGVRGEAAAVRLDGSGFSRLFAPRTTLSASGRVCLSTIRTGVGTLWASAIALTGDHLDTLSVVDGGRRRRRLTRPPTMCGRRVAASMPQTPSFFIPRGVLLYNSLAGQRLSLRWGRRRPHNPLVVLGFPSSFHVKRLVHR